MSHRLLISGNKPPIHHTIHTHFHDPPSTIHPHQHTPRRIRPLPHNLVSTIKKRLGSSTHPLCFSARNFERLQLSRNTLINTRMHTGHINHADKLTPTQEKYQPFKTQSPTTH